MTTAVFSMRDHKPCGFYVQGHSGFAVQGEDIVCSAVSSAVILTANLLEKENPLKARCSDGVFSLYCQAPHPLLEGLLAHLKEIAWQYPRNLRIYYLNLNGGK
ncbi:MAG: ribosomal-processing cysteine protease Prp [Clostridia bacterium]|nr:ribosomal-processing cysteine protease Prp [Clostridia bacterium]